MTQKVVPMKIAVDAMGSDHYPRPDVEGAVAAARMYEVEVILVGDESRIHTVLDPLKATGCSIRVVHSPEMLTMDDKGFALALKAKRKEPRTSMAVGIDLVKRGEAQAFVTAGNTGAAVATAYFRIGTIAGVERPALAPVFPTRSGSCVVLDIGANPDCKPENLVQFAVMGTVYAERVRGVKHPRVALLSTGEEAGKGNSLVRETHKQLLMSGLNYLGNVEPKELMAGRADVVLTDGFTGNILLKSSEAVASLILETVRDKIQSASALAKLGGLLVRPTLRSVAKLLNPSEEGAAPLLGIDGLVFIGHGRSDALAIQNAVRVAKLAVEADVLNSIRAEIGQRLPARA
ncbi:MAG: phosphate acyltransferase PlsX [Anaerolineales bacterium]|jgi:glycerol-3-phosphate acyltransferase PlsX